MNLGYVSGAYDVLREKYLEKLDMAAQVSQEKGNTYFAVGVYTDELCEELGLGEPLKSVEDRIKIIQYIDGVDFAFPISSFESDEIEKSAREALEEFEKRKQPEEEGEKEFDIVYAPGTYDLFHLGHLENLLEAASRGRRLIVGVKSDELVQKHKGKKPILDAQERIAILRHFKFVYDVFRYYGRDPRIASKWVERKYGKPVDAVFMGTDLEEDFKHMKDIRIIFTSRDPNMMKSRSSTAYAKKLRLQSVSSTPHRYTKSEPDTVDAEKLGLQSVSSKSDIDAKSEPKPTKRGEGDIRV